MLQSRIPLVFLAALILSANTLHAESINVDGLKNESFWNEAHILRDLTAVEPYTLASAKYPQTVYITSTPEGVVAFFEIAQPADVPRTKPITQRDNANSADRVNLIIDYDNKGVNAYNFTVTLAGSIEDAVLARNKFSSDWDGEWQHAVKETDEGWAVEILVPWTITAMDPVSAEKRSVGIYVDRVLKSAGHRYASPAIRFSQSDYLKSLTVLEIPNYSASTFQIFPYASVALDNLSGDSTAKVGVDWFYRYSNQFQMIGSINPDFGQVESDDLVVDFSAIEVYFSDKRPFFTENNDDFSLPLPDSGQLIYTRRMGGNRDDGYGVADIDVAAKIRTANEFGSIAYMAVLEDDYSKNIGKQFQVLRPKTQIGNTALGYTFLSTERPFLTREAHIHAVDTEVAFASGLVARAQVMRSEVQNPQERKVDDGGWLTFDYNISAATQHTFEYFNYGAQFDISDMGFIKRSNVEQYGYLGRFVQSHIFDIQAINEVEWTLKAYERTNQQNDSLPTLVSLRVSTVLENADNYVLQLRQETEGVDDLISRGNGNWERPSRNHMLFEYNAARRGDVAWELGAERGEEGLEDAYQTYFGVLKTYFGDNFTLEMELSYQDSPDWLIWLKDIEFARYAHSNEYILAVQADWFVTESQEVRVKFQWLTIDARDGSLYHLVDNMMTAQHETTDDLHIDNMGFQLRYRYKLGALSDIFAVYSRGGYLQSDVSNEDPWQSLQDSLDLKDADQILFKVRLQF